MENYEKLNLDATYRVTLHKNLIEADFSKPLTLIEQKLLYTAISNIPAPKFKIENGKKVIANPITELPKFKMTVKEFSELLGWKEIDYKKLKKVTSDLMAKVITTQSVDNDNDVEQLQWVTYTRYINGNGMVLIELNPRLLPFVANLTENFASVGLGELTSFNSKYSPRLYFLMKQWAKIGNKTFELDELRKMLGVGYTEKNGERVYKLSEFHHFRQKAIEPSVEEINKYTGLNVTTEEIRQGKKVLAIKFHIAEKQVQKKAPVKKKETSYAVCMDIAKSISHLNYNVEAYQNIANLLTGIKNIESIKAEIIDELKKLANYVQIDGNLKAGFVISQVKKAVIAFSVTGKFNFDELLKNNDQLHPQGKPGAKIERVPEWFNKSEEEKEAEKKAMEEAGKEIDFEAERIRLLNMLHPGEHQQ